MASRGSPERVVVLLGRGEQEHGVVHRDREDHREEEDRPPGVEEALRLEAEEARAVAVLEDEPGDAERGAHREQVRGDAERRDQAAPAARRAGAGSRARARSRSRAASSRRAPARGRGSRPRRRRRAPARAGRSGAGRSCARRRGWTGPRSGSPGSAASPPPPGCAGETAAIPGSRRATACGGGARRGGARRSAACRARRGRTPAAPARSRSARCRWFGTTLIDGMPVFSPTIGRASEDEHERAAGPYRIGWRQSRSPQRREAPPSGARRCAPTAAASASTRGPSLASTAGSSVSVAARTNSDGEHDPERPSSGTPGCGTSITAESEISTVTPEKSTALPAVSIVTATASRASSFEPK